MAESNRPEAVWGESSPPEAPEIWIDADVSGAERRLREVQEYLQRLDGQAVRAEIRDGHRWAIRNPGFEEPQRPPARRPFRSTTRQRAYRREVQAEYAARRRARILLRRFCTPEQWQEYVRNDRLTVETKRSVFVLTQERIGGVEQIPKSRMGRPLHHHARRWCIHTPYGYPVEDMILAQKLAIENDEKAFLSRANPIFGGMGYHGWGVLDDVELLDSTAPTEPHTGTLLVRVGAAAQPAIDALTVLGNSAVALGERMVGSSSGEGPLDHMYRQMGTILDGVRIVRVGRPPAEQGSCCDNGETHEADGNWCRRAFRRFFEPIVEEGMLSLTEYASAAQPNRRRPWLPGFMRQKTRG